MQDLYGMRVFLVIGSSRLQVFFGDLATQSNAKMEREFSSCELARTVSVNVSRSADYVRKRALELGLPEGEDYSDAFLVKRLTRGR